jgi:hypothetical protein
MGENISHVGEAETRYSSLLQTGSEICRNQKTSDVRV